MKFLPTKFPDAWLIEPERHQDQRGFFARTWCAREFEERGLESTFVQCSISFNRQPATLRGLHYQAAPHQEVKVVRCTQGRIFDVIVDIREDSPTFGLWQGFELSASSRNAVYIPAGFAHGFQTLVGNSEVSYQMSHFYVPEAARGIHFADPQVGIGWPLPIEAVSAKDQQNPKLSSISRRGRLAS